MKQSGVPLCFINDYLIFPGTRSARFHNETDGCSLFTIDDYIGERRYTDQIYTAGRNKPSANSHSFYCLIDSSGSNGLHLCLLPLS